MQVAALAQAFDRLTAVSEKMRDQMKSDPLQWASNTYPALTAFGEVTMVWRLLDMAIIAARAMERGREKCFLYRQNDAGNVFYGCDPAAHSGDHGQRPAGRPGGCRDAGGGVLMDEGQRADSR